jgi:hypothetical protein
LFLFQVVFLLLQLVVDLPSPRQEVLDLHNPLQEVLDMELPNKVDSLTVFQGVRLKDNQEEFRMVPLGEYLLNSTPLLHPTMLSLG